jgi:hypothetical protein
MPNSSKRESRSRILEALERELMGPTSTDVAITEFPTTRYIVGRLALQGYGEWGRGFL